MGLAFASEHRTRSQQLMRLLAYLGRYGKQDIGSLIKFPVHELTEFAAALGDLVTEEMEANKPKD